MASPFFERFLLKLDKCEHLYIQPHDFPSHDAVSSSFAMQYLLAQFGFKCSIVYNGYINRIDLKNMINWLSIDIRHINKATLTPHDKIIVIDGCIGEKNVTDMPGLEVGVIDHNSVTAPDHVWYADIRPEFACSASIMVDYFRFFKIDIPEKIATALLVGLMSETKQLTRHVSAADVEAMLSLKQIADTELSNKILRNQLEYHDLENVKNLLNNVQLDNNIAYCTLTDFPKSLLGSSGDFLLSIDQVDIVILMSKMHERAYVSLRSECPNIHVNQVLKQVLIDQKVGFSGGNKFTAGGVVSGLRNVNNLPDIINQIRKEITRQTQCN